MNIEKFKELLEIHGPAMARWPDNVRGTGEKFLAESQEARKAHIQAKELSDMMQAASVPGITEERFSAIVDGITSKPQHGAEVVSFPRKTSGISGRAFRPWYVVSSGLIAASIIVLAVFATIDQSGISTPDVAVSDEPVTVEKLDETLYSMYDDEEFEEEILSLL